MVSSKIWLVILLLSSLVVASTKADSSSFPDLHKVKFVDRNTRTMYHLMEGRKRKQNNIHDPEERKKANTFVTPPLKDYPHPTPKPEGSRYAEITPPHLSNLPFVTEHRHMEYQSTTPTLYVPKTTPSRPTCSSTPKPYRKPDHCGCNPKSAYKTLSAALNQHMSMLPGYDLDYVTQPMTSTEQTTQPYYEKKEPNRPKTKSCGNKKFRKVKHFIITKKDSLREKNYRDEDLEERLKFA